VHQQEGALENKWNINKGTTQISC